MTKPEFKTVTVDLTKPIAKRVGEIAKLMNCTEDEVITRFLDAFLELEAGNLPKADSFVSKVRKQRAKSKKAS